MISFEDFFLWKPKFYSIIKGSDGVCAGSVEDLYFLELVDLV